MAESVETDVGANGEGSGAMDVGRLLPVPIGALMGTVVGNAEGVGAVFLTVESNQAFNQES